MKATLYGIGVGPGDKELLTVKAVRAIENSDVVIAPSALEDGDSIALETAKEYIKEGKFDGCNLDGGMARNTYIE